MPFAADTLRLRICNASRRKRKQDVEPDCSHVLSTIFVFEHDLERAGIFRVNLDVAFDQQIAALFELIDGDPCRRRESERPGDFDDTAVCLHIVGEVLINPNRVTRPHVFPGNK